MVEGGAVVTGGASGMGKAVVERLLARGMGVVIADFNAETGEKAVADLSRDGAEGRITFAQTDVAQESDVSAALDQVTEAFGRLDVVVNAAGIGGAFGPWTELEVDDWDYTFAVLVRGVFLGVKHGARIMREQGEGGSIVNFGSIAGLGGGMGLQAYSVAKAAVMHISRVAAVEFAPDMIRVNTVNPGIVLTPLMGLSEEDMRPILGTVQPWPESCPPESVAAVVSFLTSDEARFITGETVNVDGGIMGAGPRLGTLGKNDPAQAGLVGVSHGSTGTKAKVHRKVDVARRDPA
jgi:NAD(P)-dependent dehydrogenase (short-subunit alcohol dehydrogenase family)